MNEKIRKIIFASKSTGVYTGISREIVEVMLAHTHEKELNLSSCRLDCANVKEIAIAISHPGIMIERLDLSYNEIGNEGAKYIADAILKKNCRIHTLYLGDNALSTQGVEYIANAISQAECNVEALDLVCNNLDAAAALHISNALSNRACNIRMLYLHGDDIGAAGYKNIEEAVSRDYSKVIELSLARKNEATIRAINNNIKRWKYSLFLLAYSCASNMLPPEMVIKVLELSVGKVRDYRELSKEITDKMYSYKNRFALFHHIVVLKARGTDVISDVKAIDYQAC